ncbi:A-kinase anchor protein 13, partial [Aplochiton taeniatus]
GNPCKTEEGGDEGGGGIEEEERKDKLTVNPVCQTVLRCSVRSLSPLRRHSWGPGKNPTGETDMSQRSYSLEGLSAGEADGRVPCPSLGASDGAERCAGRGVRLDSEERGSLVSLTEEEQEGELGRASSEDSQRQLIRVLASRLSCPSIPHPATLTKSVSMLTISQRDPDVIGRPRPKRRISFSLSISPLIPKSRTFFSIGSHSSDEEEEGVRVGSFSSTSGSVDYSISEEEPGPLRSDTEGRGGTKVSRTFSYLKSKMSKKTKEKDKDKEKSREKDREKDRESREKERKMVNGHTFSSIGPPPSSLSSTSRERPWSTMATPDEPVAMAIPRRKPSIHLYHSNLAKSMSISNIAGPLVDDGPATLRKYLSQSTDSLNQNAKVNASTESLTDEGTDMMDSQLMGEFESEVRQLEADSWSFITDKKFVKLQKKEVVKRQDVIYELYQTEMHHVRTLRIMSEVYSKGLQKELQLDPPTLEKVFPVLEELLGLHSLFLSTLLERKRASLVEGREDGSFLIRRIGDVLVSQFSGSNAEQMKKVYGKFCSRHSDAVNLYKELHAKDKRFQAFTKRKMSSSIVRRLSIPECILLVTQRITKYPVLLQRILQHTKEMDEDHGAVSEALRCVKLLIAAVDSKVNEQEKKRRLKEVYRRTDSKSIMRMKSGQMFAREDLVQGRRKLLHDGPLQLKNTTGRLKDVQAMLLSDVFVFLQEKDQKYAFASLDQRSTVLSLQKLIVREVANEERGLFLITAGTDRPEMVEVLASSKEERNTWMTIIQDAMHSMEKEEDEGIPSETEEDRRQQESRAREIRELLRRKDDEIVSLLEEKIHIFRELCTSSPSSSDPSSPPIRERMLFRATSDDITKGEPIMKDALKEVESLHVLVNSGLGGGGCSSQEQPLGGSVGPICLPRRAETFGGFDSHQMNSCKNGEKEEGDESVDLRRTESDGVLKKGAPASLQLLLKRNHEQVFHSVAHLHELLTTLQAVVLQQDSFIEDQRLALSERPASRHSSSSSSSLSSSTSSSRPNSLIEQEKQRSAERQRQEAASLHKQQAAHAEERRRREREWEAREESLAQREEKVREVEEEEKRRRKEIEEEREELLGRKEEYQRDLERLRETQRRLERDREALRRETERMEATQSTEPEFLHRYQRTPSTTSEDSLRFHNSGSLDEEPKEPPEVILSSSAPTKEPFLRIGSKRMGKNFNPFSSSSSSSKSPGGEGSAQIPSRLLQLAKPKEKKDKKKKKGKGEQPSHQDPQGPEPHTDGDIFC